MKKINVGDYLDNSELNSCCVYKVMNIDGEFAILMPVELEYSENETVRIPEKDTFSYKGFNGERNNIEALENSKLKISSKVYTCKKPDKGIYLRGINKERRWTFKKLNLNECRVFKRYLTTADE